MKKRTLFGLALSVLLMVGCGDDKDDSGQLPPAEMVGVWLSRGTNRVTQAVTCKSFRPSRSGRQSSSLLKIDSTGAASELRISGRDFVQMKNVGAVNIFGTLTPSAEEKNTFIEATHGDIKGRKEAEGKTVSATVNDSLTLSANNLRLERVTKVQLVIQGFPVPSSDDERIYTRLSQEEYQELINDCSSGGRNNRKSRGLQDTDLKEEDSVQILRESSPENGRRAQLRRRNTNN